MQCMEGKNARRQNIKQCIYNLGDNFKVHLILRVKLSCESRQTSSGYGSSSELTLSMLHVPIVSFSHLVQKVPSQELFSAQGLV